MRPGANRKYPDRVSVASRARAFGETAIGTLIILILLVVVSCAATYSVLSVLYGTGEQAFEEDPNQNPVGDELGLSEQNAGGTFDVSSESGAAGNEGQNLCRGTEHFELWGNAVRWGSSNLLDSATECCQQCKDMCLSPSNCQCNAWVYCGDETNCKDNFKQCWLKKLEDVLKPEVHSSSLDNPWTSGIIHAPGKGVVGLETPLGTIRIQLQPTWAPKTVAYVRDVFQLRFCTGCQFYRAEARGEAWNEDGSKLPNTPPGPPYALLQGTLQTDGFPYSEIPMEAAPLVKRGSVCLIQGGPDFFISLGDHAEWGNSHTVFGEVYPDDMVLVEKIVALPTKRETWGSIEVAVLEDPLNFKVVRKEENAEP